MLRPTIVIEVNLPESQRAAIMDLRGNFDGLTTTAATVTSLIEAADGDVFVRIAGVAEGGPDPDPSTGPDSVDVDPEGGPATV